MLLSTEVTFGFVLRYCLVLLTEDIVEAVLRYRILLFPEDIWVCIEILLSTEYSFGFVLRYCYLLKIALGFMMLLLKIAAI